MSFYAHMRSCLQMSIVSGQRLGEIMPFPYTQRYVYVVCACVTLAAGVYLVPSDVEFCTRGGRRLAWNFAPGEQANDFNTPPRRGSRGGVRGGVGWRVPWRMRWRMPWISCGENAPKVRRATDVFCGTKAGYKTPRRNHGPGYKIPRDQKPTYHPPGEKFLGTKFWVQNSGYKIPGTRSQVQASTSLSTNCTPAASVAYAHTTHVACFDFLRAGGNPGPPPGPRAYPGDPGVFGLVSDFRNRINF